MNTNFSNQKLVFSALCIALYIVIMMCTQSFAFGQYQIRIATAMYGLSAIFPFLILPFGLANVVSNTVMGGLGLPDIIGGFIAERAAGYPLFCAGKQPADWPVHLRCCQRDAGYST